MMVEDSLENKLKNEGMPVPNVWVELEGEFLGFDKENETLKCKFPVRERYFNPLPTTLGGIIDSWIDITMGPLTVLLGQRAVSKNFTIKYLKPLGCKTVWMQIGIKNIQAALKAKRSGLNVIMDKCPKIENQRLFGELRVAGFNTNIISSKIEL